MTHKAVVFFGISSLLKPTILFAHRNFPGQFRRIAPYLAAQGWEVHALSGRAEHKTSQTNHDLALPGVEIHGYRPLREPTEGTHKYIRGTDKAILDGQGAAGAAIRMKANGITPDVIVAHSGWGSGSFLKAVWPQARYVSYLEWWYRHPARDVDPRPKGTEAEEADAHARALARNIPFMLDAVQADAIISPTRFQANDVPSLLRPMLHILPDGVDCDFFHVESERDAFSVGDETLAPDVPVVTYATRGMEPQRGFPEFMAAWEKVQHFHPNAHCVIAGTDTIHYGAKLPEGDSYLKRALAEHVFDRTRLHLVGRLPLERYADLLRRSDCHVYLTKPFVLSWSLSEAMASGSPLVVSDVEPVREALPDASIALHVDHSDIAALSDGISKTLSDPVAAKARGLRARRHAVAKYASQNCMADMAALFEQISAKSEPGTP